MTAYSLFFPTVVGAKIHHWHLVAVRACTGAEIQERKVLAVPSFPWLFLPFWDFCSSVSMYSHQVPMMNFNTYYSGKNSEYARTLHSPTYSDWTLSYPS
jgi:hypothetical protein